jgi:NADPH-dependent 2,4-dienoyl-CoA reductase/sulfur reductase-like enzyme/nitrite reductase/ring-hydroxylating ferredoxin subunit
MRTTDRRRAGIRLECQERSAETLFGACFCGRRLPREMDMNHVTTPDFASGVAADAVPDGGMIHGKVGGEEAILARRGSEFFAIGAKCSHYGGPLGKGLIVADEVHCPLHHARFSLRTGAVLCPPAFDPIPCWRVERIGASVFVRDRLPAPGRAPAALPINGSKAPASVVIVGGGGAGLAAADTLRREGYDGPVTILSADESPPYDRPNLSKDYLAGTASDEWMPLRSPEYYSDRRIELALNSRVASLDTRQKRLQTENGRTYDFDRLLLATGADPVRLPIPGADSQISYLRTYADCRALVARAASAKQVVILGGSFIGLEVAASLRQRGIAVHLVARDRLPLERVMGAEIGRFIRGLHESHGVVFHLQDTVTRLEGHTAVLESGITVAADFLVLGVGVRPLVALAERAGLKVERGVVVNEYLETSAPGIFAAGDVARWPDVRSNELVRIEHWVVAERQGQIAARNILGRRERFVAVPFFWTRQYGVAIKYVGHAAEWDAIELSGSVEARDCAVTYKRAGRTLAVATISRDLESLQAEAAMEANTR